MTDWVDWHASYADPASSLARRLTVVRRRIGAVLDAAEGPLRILSLCAGDGRDLLPELAARPWLAASALLIELDPRLAADARDRATNLPGVTVRRADAGDTSVFADALPADIRATVSAVPAMLAAGGTVIWTRGRYQGTDLRPVVRGWFTDAGLTELTFDGEPEPFGVGVARSTTPTTGEVPQRLFTFVR